MSDTESAEPPRRRRAARSKSRSAGTAPEGVPRPSAEEGARDDQNAPITEKGDDAAGPGRRTAAGRGPIQDPSDAGDGDDGSADGASGARDETTAEENRRRISLVRVARRAAEQVAALTGRHPESVISIEPRDGDWCVGVEVVETRRIPDAADILAIYEVLVRSSGDLISYRRTRRYTRGQVDRPGR
jgi:hypothetical protein